MPTANRLQGLQTAQVSLSFGNSNPAHPSSQILQKWKNNTGQPQFAYTPTHLREDALFGTHLPPTCWVVSSCFPFQLHIHCHNKPAGRSSGHRAITPTRNISSVMWANHHTTQQLHKGNTTAFSLKKIPWPPTPPPPPEKHSTIPPLHVFLATRSQWTVKKRERNEIRQQDYAAQNLQPTASKPRLDSIHPTRIYYC